MHIKDASGSSAAAAARAAHDLLVSLYSTNPTLVTALDAAYADFLDDNGLLPSDPGAEVGAAVAALYVALHRPSSSFTSAGGTGIGEWRPTPPAFAPGFGPWVSNLTPFTLKSASQFGVGPPPDLRSRRYTRDYNEVKSLGGRSRRSGRAKRREPEHGGQYDVDALYHHLHPAVSRLHIGRQRRHGRLRGDLDTIPWKG